MYLCSLVFQSYCYWCEQNEWIESVIIVTFITHRNHLSFVDHYKLKKSNRHEMDWSLDSIKRLHRLVFVFGIEFEIWWIDRTVDRIQWYHAISHNNLKFEYNTTIFTQPMWVNFHSIHWFAMHSGYRWMRTNNNFLFFILYRRVIFCR